MTHPQLQRTVPYYSQYESADLVPEFIARTRPFADDPLWAKSGADTREEYGFWAPRMCGVACLRMVLDCHGQLVPPSVPLARDLCNAGAYVREGETVRGLVYRPFAEYVTGRWNIPATVRPDLPADELPALLAAGRLVMLSVHKTIRTPQVDPPSRGGHLVLAVGATDGAVLLHNPSGLPGVSQEYAAVPWGRLGVFYAERGVILG